ncbi:hypothetical protein BGZ80_008678 [Entomortierella chlamydospora]|uniref:Uncharacterized protein n=1 Tax=Entomortierella chlamydospora TaxID=101097 RepID=A0A9P6T165_9FUNG|nr:hypothetical protein BGZ79_004942 [Entomortierella chlamydospora]KAG0017030.1 hypothetical protein BGZ80_008678 [Entomortierella chlamydospora]
MTFTILKIASTLLIVACAVQAAPVAERDCVGDACSQSVQSGKVNLGSTTNIVPVTQVVPITRYQPVVQAYAPIVQAEADCDERGESYYDSSRPSQYIWPHHGHYMNYYPGPGEEMMTMYPYRRYGDYMDRYGRMHRLHDITRFNRGDMDSENISGNRLGKRHVAPEKSEEEEGQMGMQDTKEGCVPSATESCEQSVPISKTDMGSFVSVQPSNVILPSTVYQGHVQSKEANVYAAPEQHNTLAHHHVELGSNTMIQPVTKVFPQTTYQPSVDQKATTIEAAEQSDLSLARSSVSLGSSVTIRPTTTVEPLTIFQPSIKSLPFLITDEGCV